MFRNEMKPEITKTENNTSDTRGQKAVLRTITIGVVFLLLFGLLIDAFSGFYVLRHSKSVYAGCAGLFLLSILYLLGEAGSDWINSKDETTHPWHKRLLHLLMLLAYAGLVILAAGMRGQRGRW
jgi:hypothetical protein